ncbi:K(+)-transporting ATPase subunit C [Mucilaginibacter sp. 14171R-50]|uniref:K(+)-transporting ATPase subunit C n=1 Tax=Mucilaginibacter sp. 14171R-50 TaxID=2703789 RepID=UPI00138B4221|nr:K(+)-transporting ATPase subunit C [Mucilaginibacter sp. 14171R-50]QHS54653.1 K(+)-transporting ATPase subunit C [Mucilaginibacter sp. 14171R-50]
MKTLIQSIRLTLVLTVLLCIAYPIIIAFAGKLSKGKGDGETITMNGNVIGYAALGQKFDKPQYFWSRPSAVGYNAAGSAGSNKGPSNPDYLKEVSNRIDTLLKYHPYLKRSEIPADMVTASGSGLDPDISPAAAQIQVKRVAQYRKLDEQKVAALVANHIHKPMVGPAKVNVLKLNVALDQLK